MKTPFADRSRAPRPRRAHSFTILALPLLVATVIAMTIAWSVAGASSSAGASPRTAATPQPGGTFVVGMQPGEGQFDPVLMDGAAGDVSLISQVLEPLVTLAPDFSVQPALATAWSTPDGGKTWHVTLRGGVEFSNAQSFTSADVLASFDRLRSTTLGSPTAATYADIRSVVADDATHVTFHLKTADSEFMASLTDFHAKMLCRSVTDPMTQLVGTGPFMLKSYAADNAVLTRNPHYWGEDAQTNQLPYFDQVDFVYSSDATAQIAALKAGTLDWVGGLSAAQKQTVDADARLKSATTPTNDCFELQIRCDMGPGKKLAFRQALMAGTDLTALVASAIPGVAVPGNGTLVGPAYAADYLTSTVAQNRAAAKRLLAKAGYGRGITIKLVTQTSGPIPAFATAWKAQMKKIGVTVSIKKVSPSVYYADKGTNTWTKAAFGIVDWGTRAVPSTYFKLALATHATWNYSRWSNAPFDKLTKQIPLTADDVQRGDLYKRAERILQRQVPMINFGVLLGVAGESASVDGVVLAPDWEQTQFSTGYFTK
jgi:peptide/nickel transport system substrate-binding protein